MDRYLKIGLHNHTSKYSECSEITPEELVRISYESGLHGIVITEHNHLWKKQEIKELKEKSVKEKLCDESFLILSGQETTAIESEGEHFHLIVIGVGFTLPAGLTIKMVIDKAHSNGGVVIAAHPYRFSGLRDFFDYDIDGVEILNPNQDNKKLIEMLAGRQDKNHFALLAGDDVHHSSQIGQYCVLVPRNVKSEKGIVRAIKQKKTKPYIIDINERKRFNLLFKSI